MKRKYFSLCFLFMFVMFLSFSYAFAEELEDVESFEILIEDIDSISVNHEQGGIGFVIQSINFFYYIESEDNCQKIIATSLLLNDIQNASTIQIRHIPYGMHRKITNILLFYGNREIPENLKLKTNKTSKTRTSAGR